MSNFKSVKRLNESQHEKNSSESDEKRNRFGFNMGKDLFLLKAAVKHNPWQLGHDKWNLVVADMSQNFESTPITTRTAKHRINLLLKKYEDQQLTAKTGTEEEISERGSLLEEISGYKAESEATINKVVGPSDPLSLPNTNIDDQNVENLEDFPETVETPLPNPKTKVVMKNLADQERETAFSMFAPDPNTLRRKRKLCNEDEMITKKQNHDIEMDFKKHELEIKKLELETKREERLEEEGRRRDELANGQLQFQTQMMQILAKLADK